jgi:hypothetical protein
MAEIPSAADNLAAKRAEVASAILAATNECKAKYATLKMPLQAKLDSIEAERKKAQNGEAVRLAFYDEKGKVVEIPIDFKSDAQAAKDLCRQYFAVIGAAVQGAIYTLQGEEATELHTIETGA